MHVLMLMVLFNIHSGSLGDYKVDKIYPDGAWHQCATEMIDKGPQKPDKDGNVKLYECVLSGDKPEVHLVTEL